MHVNVLLNIAIKKNDFNIHLFHVLIHNRRKCENRFIIYKLYHRRESVIIITIFFIIRIFELYNVFYNE